MVIVAMLRYHNLSIQCTNTTSFLLSNCRSVIDSYGNTAMHKACQGGDDKAELVEFLIEEEKRRGITEKESPLDEVEIPSYKIKDKYGRCPAFLTFSSSVVELLLQFQDLAIIDGHGKSLLWHCAERGMVTKRILNDVRIKTQMGQRHLSTLPIEEALQRGHAGNVYSAVVIIKSLQEQSQHVRLLTLRAIIGSVGVSFRTLTEVLKSTGDIVWELMQENKSSLNKVGNFYRLLAMTMRAMSRFDWFEPENQGKVTLSNYITC